MKNLKIENNIESTTTPMFQQAESVMTLILLLLNFKIN